MEEKKVQAWEVSIKDGVLNCRIDLSVPDAVTIGLGVADRIKSLLMSMEIKTQMQKQMQEMKTGIIKVGVVEPHGNDAA